MVAVFTVAVTVVGTIVVITGRYLGGQGQGWGAFSTTTPPESQPHSRFVLHESPTLRFVRHNAKKIQNQTKSQNINVCLLFPLLEPQKSRWFILLRSLGILCEGTPGL